MKYFELYAQKNVTYLKIILTFLMKALSTKFTDEWFVAGVNSDVCV